jgi:hypothetical protein
MTQLQGSMRKDYVRGLAKDSIDDVLTEVMIDLIERKIRDLKSLHPKMKDRDIYEQAVKAAKKLLINTLIVECRRLVCRT